MQAGAVDAELLEGKTHIRPSSFGQSEDRKHAAHALGHNRSKGNSRHPHLEGEDEEAVEGDVDDARDHQNEERSPRIALRAKHLGRVVIKHQEGKPREIDAEIKRRFLEVMRFGAHHPQQIIADEEAKHPYPYAGNQSE